MINGSAGRKVFKFVENNDFTCKTTDEVTTLNINAFMLMTASSISHSLSTRGKLWHRQTLSMYKNKWNMRGGGGGLHACSLQLPACRCAATYFEENVLSRTGDSLHHHNSYYLHSQITICLHKEEEEEEEDWDLELLFLLSSFCLIK